MNARPDDAGLAGEVRVLLRQLAHRYRTLEHSLTADVDAETAVRRLGQRPSIAWHALHLFDAMGVVREAAVGGPAAERGEGGSPSVERWPEQRDQVIVGARSTLTALEGLPVERWLATPRIEVHPTFRDSLSTALAFVEGHVYHLGYHLGAIGVLRAEWGCRWDAA